MQNCPSSPKQTRPASAAYRAEIADLLRAYPIESLPHDRIIANIEEASRHFNVLVLKTNMAIPYTSVFIRLDCKYWSADAEKRLRSDDAAAAQHWRLTVRQIARPEAPSNKQHGYLPHPANHSGTDAVPAHRSASIPPLIYL